MAENTISVPGSDYNSIDYDGDVDTYDVWLWGGSSYDFDVLGDDVDPTLTVTSPFGTQLASDDDSGVGLDSHIDFTPSYSGLYTLAVAGYGSDTGSYTLQTEYNDWSIS
jgi:serralysin